MKKIVLASVIFSFFFLMYAQEQSAEFDKKIRVDSAKNAVSESDFYASQVHIEDDKEKILAEDSVEPELTVTKINFIGLKKTRKSYIEGKLEKFLGKSVAETDMHGLETALQLEGLFDDIKISFERISDSEAGLSVSVKEKITFIPLPFAVYSDSSVLAGGVVMDTNAFGRKDMFMIGAFFSANAKTGMAAFSKNPQEGGIPGFSLFFSGSSSTPEIMDMDEELVLKYDAIFFNGGFSVIEKIGEYFTFSQGFSLKSVTTENLILPDLPQNLLKLAPRPFLSDILNLTGTVSLCPPILPPFQRNSASLIQNPMNCATRRPFLFP